jgi:hypothetical protein
MSVGTRGVYIYISNLSYRIFGSYFPKNRKFIRIYIRKIKVSKNVGKKSTGWKLEL